MSTASTITPMRTPFIPWRTRAYYAPVNRVTETPTLFDPALQSAWSDSAPPSPWMDLGWISEFTRSAESLIAEVDTGMPASIALQTRTKLGATVSFCFATWSKLTMALATGSQHMNVLAAPSMAAAIGSGAKATPAMGLAASSTATSLYPATAPATPWMVGSMVAVDVDYASQVGFVGTAISAGYVASAAAVGSDADYVRRVTFNVGRVIAIGSDGGLQLASPLLGGAPSSGMKVQQLTGFVDREGGRFFHEWSALFVMEGVQGDRLFLHYPRLQSCQSAQETTVPLEGTLAMVLPTAMFRALPVTDGNDGELVVCYRTYQPARFSYV
jgi:hypothetical protein